MARSHLEGSNRDDMEKYILHHLKITGVKSNLFDESAITAIHQGSGGLFLKSESSRQGIADRSFGGKIHGGHR